MNDALIQDILASINCEDCKFFDGEHGRNTCTITAPPAWDAIKEDERVTNYVDDYGDYFEVDVGPHFGCKHFEHKEEH